MSTGGKADCKREQLTVLLKACLKIVARKNYVGQEPRAASPHGGKPHRHPRLLSQPPDFTEFTPTIHVFRPASSRSNNSIVDCLIYSSHGICSCYGSWCGHRRLSGKRPFSSTALMKKTSWKSITANTSGTGPCWLRRLAALPRRNE